MIKIFTKNLRKALTIFTTVFIISFTIFGIVEAAYHYDSTFSGGAGGAFNSNRQITSDSNGNTYVVDNINGLVKKYDSSGVYVQTFGTRGSSNGQLLRPSGVVVDSTTGNVYVIDQSISTTSNALIDRKIVAGGGGGYAEFYGARGGGGNGGTPNGGNASSTLGGGGGGTQTAGGYAGTGYSPTPPTAGTFGVGGSGTNDYANGLAGGGGGGWYGGGGGNGNTAESGQGGGGSGYYDPSSTNVSIFNGYNANSNNGSVAIAPITDAGGGPVVGATTTFSYTGGQQTYTTPANCIGIIVNVIGAGGGSGGGTGGRVQATYYSGISAGRTIYVNVGGKGGNSGTSFNGGGTGYYGNSGGGASDIRMSTVENNRVVVFDSSGTWVRNIGPGVAGSGNFTFSAGIAMAKVSTTTYLYVGDYGTNSVVKINLTDYSTSTFNGSPGHTIPNLRDVTSDSTGNIYVALESGVVRKFDSSGSWVSDIGSGQLSSAWSVSVDPQNNVYVADKTGNIVKIFNQAGTLIGSINGSTGPQNLSNPLGVYADANSGIFISNSDSNNVQRWLNTSVTLSRLSMEIAEGLESTYTMVLDSAPTAPVDIQLSTSTPITGAGISVLPERLTFTPDNWNTPQTVYVYAVPNAVVDSSRTVNVIASASSSDAGFNNGAISNVVVTIFNSSSWTGSGAWSDANNWTPIGVPTVNDAVIIPYIATTTPIVDLDSDWVTPHSINALNHEITFTSSVGNSPGMNITGNAVFNGSSVNNNTITGNVIFNNTSANWGTIQGNVVFNDTSHNYNYIQGNVDVYYPSNKPQQGTVTGTVTYHGYPAYYFNSNTVGTGDGSWSNPANWWSDMAFTIPAGTIPTTTDSVYIYSSLLANTVPFIQPNTVSGLKAWYKADSFASTTVDGTAVATWLDSSGNGYNATEATNRPLYKTNIFGTKPAIQFDGGNDRLLSTFSQTTPYTMYVVGYWHTDPNGQQKGMIDGRTDLESYLFTTGGSNKTYFNNYTHMIGPIYDPITTKHIYKVVVNGANSILNANKITPVVSDTLGTKTITGFTMGSRANGGEYGAVNIAEVILYNGAISSGNQTALDYYLGDKYSINMGQPIAMGASVPTAIFDNGAINTIPMTVSVGAIFNGTSTNASTITGTTTFVGDLSIDSGTTTSAIIRQYTTDATTTKNFTSEGNRDNWIVESRGAIVNITGATYSTSTSKNVFKAYSNGDFITSNGLVIPAVSITAPVASSIATTTKWKPNISWGNSTLCQYKIDGGEYTTINCANNGSDIPHPNSAGSHTLYVMGIDSRGDLSERIVQIYYDNTVPVDTDCTDILDESSRPYYYLATSTTQGCVIRVNGVKIKGATFTVNGDINGDATSTGASGFNFTLENITVTGTTTSNGAVGITGVTGGSGGNITISTSTTGKIMANGGNGPSRGGNGGNINIVYSQQLASSTTVTAIGGNATSCGFGGNGGTVNITDSNYEQAYVSVAAGNNQSTVGIGLCPIPPSGSSGSGGSRVVTGTYAPPGSGGGTNVNIPNVPVTPYNPISGGIKLTPAQLEKLGLKPVPKLAFGVDNLGTTNFGNLLENVKAPGSLKLNDIKFTFDFNLSGFLFAPLSKEMKAKLDKYKDLNSMLASAGIIGEQNIASLNTRSVPLPEATKKTAGLFTVTASTTPVKIYVASDQNYKLMQLIQVRPNTVLDIDLEALTKDKAEGIFSNKIIKFTNGTGNSIKTTITAPAKPNRYYLTTDAAPLPLAIDVLGDKDTGTKLIEKKSFWQKIKDLFK